jgi:hypothetical protein
MLNLPQELDLKIYQVNVSLSSEQFAFTGIMISDPTKTAKAEHFSLDRVEIQASYTFAQGTTTKAIYAVGLLTSIRLKSQNIDEDAILSILCIYNEPLWNLHGSIQDLKMSALVSLFPGTDGTTVMDIMDHFEFLNLELDYNYDSSGKGSQFSALGSLLLDVFQLDFSFDWTSASWDIFATLRLAPGVDTTLKNLLGAMLKDSSLVDNIPDFADFAIGSQEFGGGQSSGLELLVKKSTDATTKTEAIVFAMSLLLKGSGNEPDVRFSFVQVKEIPSASNTPSIKRLVRISVNSFPWSAVPNIPMVGSLTQPFNELDYGWLHDESTQDLTTQGLTRQDIALINAAVQAHDPALAVRVKDLVAPAKAKPEDILLAPGSHFLVTADDKSSPTGDAVILDYLFRSAKDNPNSGTSKLQVGRVLDAAAPPDNEPEGEASMAKHDNTQGPLSISNIGLRYSSSTLSVLFDAKVTLGPIEFSLLGFGIGLSFQSTSINLRTLTSATPTLSLKGLACEYNKPPLTIAGIFEDLSAPGLVKFVGGVSVSFDPYNFLAVGSYGEITNNIDKHTYKSIFLFCKLEGPLVEFEFAEISGICGGFGYNSYLRYPSLAELYQFPFIDTPSGLSGGDPLAILQSLTNNDPSNKNKGWVSDQEGSIWLAAGLKVKAFQTLSVNAVVVLEFNPYVNLGIFADAVASLPAATDSSPPTYVLYVELGIAATVDFHGGTMRVEGSLAPNSYVLNPLCHLSGGFALCYWFAGSPFEGDWVFTIGGYHAAFSPPDHYPKPDRLQIYWDLGGGLSITGQAYLAVTPKVCMLGGLLSAVLDAVRISSYRPRLQIKLTIIKGPLGAYFDAHADLLITYKPFHFKGSAGVDIGVRFTLDLFICTIHINVDISAELTLYGPPFGGDVYVDFWVFGFSIHFGDDEATQDPLNIEEFNTLLLQQHDDTSSATTAVTTSAGGAPPSAASKNDHVFAVEKGRHISNKSSNDTVVPEGAAWIVKPQGFVFRVQSRFAIETSTCNGESGVNTPTPIYAKPMHLVAGKMPGKGDDDQHITSTMTITITQTEGKEQVPIPAFSVKQVLKKVPQALWAPCKILTRNHYKVNQISCN